MRLFEVFIYGPKGNILRRIPYPALRYSDAMAFGRALRPMVKGAVMARAVEV